jgi:hypothetical protein
LAAGAATVFAACGGTTASPFDRSSNDSGTSMEGGRPQRACTSDSECDDRGMLCDPRENVCVLCRDDGDCPSAYRCEEAVCVLPEPSGGGGPGSGGVSQGDGGTGGASGGTGGISPGTGGTSGGAGGQATGGTGGNGAGGTGGGDGCPPGEKLCGGLCLAPSPGNGCAPTGCTACPAPPENGFAVCAGSACSFECSAGYVESGGACVPLEPMECVASACPPCGGIGGQKCCKSDDTCGCRLTLICQ